MDRPRAGRGPTTTLFSAEVKTGVHVIQFSRADVLDPDYIARLGDDIYRYLKPVVAPRVVIDMSPVRALSSSALGMFMALRKVIERQDGKLCIAGADADVLQVFKITKLDDLIPLHATAHQGIKSLT